VYVEDAVDAVLLASKRPRSSEVVFNIGTGTYTSIRNLVALTLQVVGLKPNIVFTQGSWKGDIKRLRANVERLMSLGFKPTVSLKDGVAKTVEWFNGVFRPSWSLGK
jgi:UDP-glucose 4-epimerase